MKSTTITDVVTLLKQAQSQAAQQVAEAKSALKDGQAELKAINKALRSFGVKVSSKADTPPKIPNAIAERLTSEGRAKLSKAMKARHREARRKGYSSLKEMLKAEREQ
jgi:hypothetical protein